MRILLCTLVLLVVALAPLAALAGDCGGFSCENACPLAKAANQHRADGYESARLSVEIQKEVAATVLANLEKI
jgi:hypothetical protein